VIRNTCNKLLVCDGSVTHDVVAVLSPLSSVCRDKQTKESDRDRQTDIHANSQTQRQTDRHKQTDMQANS